MRSITAGALAAAVLTLGLGSVAVGVRSAHDGVPTQTPAPVTRIDGPTWSTRSGGPGADPMVGEDAAAPAPDPQHRADGEVHESFAATPSSRPDDVGGPIGGVDPSGSIPDGLDLAAFPPVEGGVPVPVPAGPDGRPGSLTVGPGCAHQCIESGVAYPRGFGAELVVETSVPAELFLSVIADGDGDGDWEHSEFRWSDGRVTRQSWAFDALTPGQTYHVMVTATDQHDDTSHAWGEFTTLSRRDVSVAISGFDVSGGPGNVDTTTQQLRLEDGDLASYEMGDWVDLDDTDRTLDLGLLVIRGWEADDPCEAHWPTLFDQPQGDDDTSCVAWNTAVGAVDLDGSQPPASHWSSHRFHATLHTPTGAGDALPQGYGDPRHFHVEAVVEIVVTYR